MSAQRLWGAVLGLAVLAGCSGGDDLPPGLHPNAPRLGPIQRVNQHTLGDQQQPAVAQNAAGDVVIVWESFGQDGSHFGIFGRRYRGDQPQGDEFQVNSYTTGRQVQPAVAMDGQGRFVVVWRSSLQDGPGGTIYGQRFDADGRPLGGEFRIGPGDSEFDSQNEPRVAMNASGAFAVTWGNREISAEALAQGRNDIEERAVQARLYGANGAALTGVLNVAGPAVEAVVRSPDVGIADDGRFVISWISAGEPRGIRLRRYGATGSPLGDSETVHLASAIEAVDFPVLAVAPDGRFAIGWEATTFGYLPLGVFVRRYDREGAALSTAQRVAEPGTRLLERVAMAMDAQGRIAVLGQGFDQVVISGVYDDTGETARVTAMSSARWPAGFSAVALGAEGEGTAAWTTFGEDGSGRGIAMNRVYFP